MQITQLSAKVDKVIIVSVWLKTQIWVVLKQGTKSEHLGQNWQKPTHMQNSLIQVKPGIYGCVDSWIMGPYIF